MSFTDDAREPARTADPRDGFQAFARAVRERLDVGRVAYGDASFSADPGVLLAELQAEALDLAGWGFVLWTRLEAMRAALGNVQSAPTGAPTDATPEAEQTPASPAPARMVGAERGRLGAEP